MHPSGEISLLFGKSLLIPFGGLAFSPPWVRMEEKGLRGKPELDKYFGFARTLLDRGIASEQGSYDGAGQFYDQTITEESDIPFYLDLARRAGGPVLDLACGTGRILLPLLRERIDVCGLDLSPQMLRIAQAKAAAAGHAVGLVEGDIRDFDLSRRFDLIILPYYTMIYMLSDADRLGVFRSTYRHLTGGGVFAFDFDAGEETPGESKPWVSLQRLDEQTGMVVLRIAQIKVPHKNLRLVNQITYCIGGDRAEVTVSGEAEATVPAETMCCLLRETGFAVEGLYSDYCGTPYAGGAECVVVARK